MSSKDLRSCRVEVSGIVQGIGFRPYVYRLALAHSLSGYVLNHDRGVTIEVEGLGEALERFLVELPAKAPEAARLDRVEVFPLEGPQGYGGFEIRESLAASADKFVPVSADLAVCTECRSEIWDPANRRYFYPFTNCTNCGPRFTLIRDMPYDRKHTTMASFTMCPLCQAEYEDPANRRFHAQPNACPACGPQLKLLDARGRELVPPDRGRPRDRELIETCVSLLREGAILALKGVGGFHLACDALNEGAVSQLRSRKFREYKPFAVMFPDSDFARQFVKVSEQERGLLSSSASPIVLMEKREGVDLAPSVAPRNRFLGVMLPYSPLHELLVRSFGGPLVMTSANRSDEPIVTTNEEAFERLGGADGIADHLLVHDREIHIRCDDSVVQVFGEKSFFYRRSRGYAPLGVRLKREFAAPILAVGAELKNTFCLTRGDQAFLSHHIGDLENVPTLLSFEKGIEHFSRLFNIEPRCVAHDLHPEYLNTKWVQDRFGAAAASLPRVAVQHHHAHIAGCLAENGFEGPVIGFALDGTGYGSDGTIWGGEVLLADCRDFRRVGALRQTSLPGGLDAMKHPWRMAMAYFFEATGSWDAIRKLPFLAAHSENHLRVLEQRLERRLNSYSTSSCGRLFDAVSAAAGVVPEAYYEGQAAVELERVLQEKSEGRGLSGASYRIAVQERAEDGFLELDWRPLFRELLVDLERGRDAFTVSGRFHEGLIAALVETADRLSVRTGIQTVALSGGCFMNEYLRRNLRSALEGHGFQVLTHERVPSNDGGIALGQAVVADRVLRGEASAVWGILSAEKEAE